MTVRARVEVVLTSVTILTLGNTTDKELRLQLNVAYGRKKGFRNVKCMYNAI